MKQQNNIKGKVTLADLSLGSILIPALCGGVEIGDIVKENDLPRK